MSDSEEDEDRISFFRWFRPRLINDTVQSFVAEQEEVEEFLHTGWTPSTPVIKGYIDDFNVVEKINEESAITHITENKTTARIHAPSSQVVFHGINNKSNDIGMRVNPDKTQTLCISSATSKTSSSFINFENKRIESGPHLKILGFHFDTRPTVAYHVLVMISKARNRLWTLRFLKKSGLSENELLHVYKVFIRPILDFAVPTYHPQLTAEMSSNIEHIQASAMKIIFGRLVSYETVLSHSKIEEHWLRRQKIVQKFAIKASRNEAFEENWFPPNPGINYGLRNRKKFLEPVSRTHRYYNSPIQYMRRLLNSEENTD